ncbi:MAG: hypothetical protein KDD15_26975, partial [Lewinella sp.]|nr:hypothetical protein [Lewinella sp.]
MKISNAERIPVWIQAIGIALFLVIPALFAPRPAGEPFFNLSNPTLRDILSNLFMIVFFYTNYYFLIPKAYLKQKHTLYWLSVLTALVIIILLPSLITGFVPWASQHPPSGNPSGAPQIP